MRRYCVMLAIFTLAFVTICEGGALNNLFEDDTVTRLEHDQPSSLPETQFVDEVVDEQAVQSPAAQKKGNSDFHVLPLRMAKVGRGGLWHSLLEVGGHSETLHNSGNTVFYADVKIGSNTESFKVVVDTGSMILWVPDNVCQSPACGNHKKYKVTDSKTGKVYGHDDGQGHMVVKAGELQYGTGTMQGIQVSDTVEFAGVSCDNVGFLVATAVGSNPFLSAPFDGILGVGRSTQIPGAPQGVEFNVMKAFAAAKKISKNIISFHFSMAPDGAGGAAGSVVIGDPSWMGQITWNPVAQSVRVPMWALELSSFTVGSGKNLCEGGCIAVIDTGTSLLITSSDMAKQINDEVGVKPDCSNIHDAPGIKIKFGSVDKEYDLPAHSVTLQGQGVDQHNVQHNVCQPGVASMQQPDPLVEPERLMETDAGSKASAKDSSEFSLDDIVKALMGGGPDNVMRKMLAHAPPPERMQGGPAPGGSKWAKITAMLGSKQIVILGDLFLRKYHAAFDNTAGSARIGFSERSEEADAAVRAMTV